MAKVNANNIFPSALSNVVSAEKHVKLYKGSLVLKAEAVNVFRASQMSFEAELIVVVV